MWFAQLWQGNHQVIFLEEQRKLLPLPGVSLTLKRDHHSFQIVEITTKLSGKYVLFSSYHRRG
jgi:hypothetical protein